ncbi:hydroxyacid dehydrogenase [Megamonas hypermegale]|uniref:hydroxyacid dehydrogenase n=1 Tax=Megamonas hypermegale TaxID=158847 RepID=UPI0013A64FE4|nr:hydroxyacid dehydrogenase [Megamonas hypermegale]
MKYCVLLLKDVHSSGKELLKQNDCEVKIAKGQNIEDYIDELKICDAIFVRNEPVTREMIDKAPNLKVIAKHGVGYDNIDVAYATEKKIQVVYVPKGNIESVADMTMLHILSCARKIHQTQNEFYGGNYNIRYQMSGTHQLKNKILGLIGCGNIAKLVAKRAKYGFGMKVIGYHPRRPEGIDENGIQIMNDREAVFKMADFISIHLPAKKDTIHSIGMYEFELMKPTAYLINTARGNIVREDELITALEKKEIAGAGLDVFAKEPVDLNNPLLHMENVFATPHCSGLTDEASENLSYIGAKQILEVFHHEPVDYPVNNI